MLDFVFTVDYEIYGNGEGSLKELVYEPTEKLKSIFGRWNAPFVTFVEVAEIEMIETKGSDPHIALVKQQILDLYRSGYELGLHLHQWWYNASFEQGKWQLDNSEYNLCVLPEKRIVQIVERSIAYLRRLVGDAEFVPLSFRAGHLLFHPGRELAIALAKSGIKIDSSVYKGGLWHQHNLDYRRSLRNGSYWNFTDCSNIPDPKGCLLELPIHTQMVPTWRMFTSKRVALNQRGGATAKTSRKMISRIGDFLRISYPLKFDLGQMNIDEIMGMAEGLIKEDRKNPMQYKPVVVLLHTKDPIESETFGTLLNLLDGNGVRVSNFDGVYKMIESLNGK